MTRLVAFLGVVLVTGAVVHSQNAGAGRLRAGAHKVEITPKQSDLPIATDSIRDQLLARAGHDLMRR